MTCSCLSESTGSCFEAKVLRLALAALGLEALCVASPLAVDSSALAVFDSSSMEVADDFGKAYEVTSPVYCDFGWK